MPFVRKQPENPDAYHGHTLICGVTESGKTTLAHMMAGYDNEDKKQIIVYDPVLTETLAGEWPSNAAVFDDEQKFLAYINRHGGQETAVYIDEAADIFSHRQVENRWILTRGRHLGYDVTAITQRPKMIHPSCRFQCNRAFIFRLRQSDFAEVTGDFGHKGTDLVGQQQLDKGDFLALHSGHAQAARANVFILLNSSRGTEWSTISNPPLLQSSSLQSSGASTRSAKRSPDSNRPRLSPAAHAPRLKSEE